MPPVSIFLRASILAMALLPAASPLAMAQDERLQIGITLHPYYSFVANIVGDLADVVPLINAAANPHGYQPQGGDIVRAQALDVLIVNGIGHDEWAFEIIQAAGRGADLPLIHANDTVAMIPIAGDRSGQNVVNPHTFISTTAAVQQVYEIARRLGEIDPANAIRYRINAQAYGTKIRQLRGGFMQRFADLDTSGFRVASVHAGYDYLFAEFGLEIVSVIEPRHGVSPTASQLAGTIEAIEAAGVNTLFTEKYFEGELAETIENETGVRVYSISHMSSGPYTAEKFLEEMESNIAVLLQAVEDAAGADQ